MDTGWIDELQAEGVLVSFSAGVMRLTLDRPARKNALTLTMYRALARALQVAAEQGQVRAILLDSSSENFTAGNDLGDFLGEPKIHPAHPAVQFIDALRLCPKPVVAKVRGHAVGIGMTLLMHVDFALVEETASLQMPFVNLGLAPEFAASALLPALVGRAAAKRILLLGQPIDGLEAARLGLVTYAVSDETLDKRTQALLQVLVAQPPQSLRRAKELMRASTRAAEEAALAAEYAAIESQLAGGECQEAIAAFFAKRAPDFSGFE